MHVRGRAEASVDPYPLSCESLGVSPGPMCGLSALWGDSPTLAASAVWVLLSGVLVAASS